MNLNAIVVVAPSDHWIEDEVQFVANLERSFQYCEHKDSLMTIGNSTNFSKYGIRLY